MFAIRNNKLLVTITSKAPVTTSDALVPTRYLMLVRKDCGRGSPSLWSLHLRPPSETALPFGFAISPQKGISQRMQLGPLTHSTGSHILILE